MISRTEIINYIINQYNFNGYLEIGVRDSKENFNLINIKNKEGVDPEPITPVKYKMTSDAFFANYVGDKKYDIIFIDGLHTAEQVYLDVKNAIKHLNPNGFLVLHDCNPPTKYHTRSYEEYLKTRGEWNGDVFKGFIKLKQELLNWNCFVINEDFGCGIITKTPPKNELGNNTNTLNKINWEYFNNNRDNLLNLISFNKFTELY